MNLLQKFVDDVCRCLRLTPCQSDMDQLNVYRRPYTLILIIKIACKALIQSPERLNIVFTSKLILISPKISICFLVVSTTESRKISNSDKNSVTVNLFFLDGGGL